MYYNFFHIGNIVFYVCLGFSVLLLVNKIIYHIVGLFPSKKLPDANKEHKFAILIPARNESKVIEGLLNSIKNQTYNQDLLETYVIVEKSDDPTCQIAKNYNNTNVFVREHLELKGKGYALDECIQKIFKENKEYDAIFIFDADNILSPTFIEEMNKSYDAGYKIALGYRNSKNWNDGWIASCSALTFSMINTFHNKCRAKFNRNVILSGTGFYIDFDEIKKIGGWKFYSLTEDYELTLFSALNNINSTYNEYAEFFDEQPTSLRTSWNQRLRWVKGHSQSDKKYIKKLIKSAIIQKGNKFNKTEFALSILPIATMLITIIGYTIYTFILSIIGFCLREPLAIRVLMACGVSAVVIYIFLVLYTALMISAERKRINLTHKNAFICCLANPFFMFMYIPIFFRSISKKQVEWTPIVHSVTKIDKK